MEPSDHELLSQYAREKSQVAFAELVRRHVNLVYSAARRQVRSPQLAEEITQSTFVDLARQALQIPSTPPLVAWLHVVVRRTAVDAIRRESRRLARERDAAIIPMTSEPSAWAQLAPLLDEAIESLEERDRSAILLRYFENKSLREVGQTLGTSDDTAQKRVSRAIEQLRAFFGRRGVTIASAALVRDLSAHAIVSAPIALPAAIAAATAPGTLAMVGGTVATPITVAASVSKLWVIVSCGCAMAFGLYEAGAWWRTHEQVARVRRQTAEQLGAAQILQREAAEARQQLGGSNGVQLPPAGGSDAALEAQLTAWMERVAALNRALDENPVQRIPELALLRNRDWLLATINPRLERDGIPERLSFLRTKARERLYETLSRAFDAPGFESLIRKLKPAFPSDFVTMQAAIVPPLDPAILARYDIVDRGDRYALVERPIPGFDNDRYITIELTKEGRPRGDSFETLDERAIKAAYAQYAAEHDGRHATGSEQLSPYLQRSVSATRVNEWLGRARQTEATR